MVCLWSGEQGSDKEGGRQGQEQAIASPWDIVRIGQGAFAIAMAGSQKVRLTRDTAQVMANNSLQEGGGRQGQDQAIASPWDIVSIGQGAIAMAGSHQVRLSSDTGHG